MKSGKTSIINGEAQEEEVFVGVTNALILLSETDQNMKHPQQRLDTHERDMLQKGKQIVVSVVAEQMDLGEMHGQVPQIIYSASHMSIEVHAKEGQLVPYVPPPPPSIKGVSEELKVASDKSSMMAKNKVEVHKGQHMVQGKLDSDKDRQLIKAKDVASERRIMSLRSRRIT